MAPDELRAACAGHEYVTLHLPPPNSQGYSRRLCGKRGPRGEIMCGTSERGQVVKFLSKAVLRHLDKMEAIERKDTDD